MGHQHSMQRQVSAQLSDAQHGFQSGWTTVTNLFNFMVIIALAVDVGLELDVAYFDCTKAFDIVDILLKKLAEVGYTTHLLQFFVTYMEDRQQYVAPMCTNLNRITLGLA